MPVAGEWVEHDIIPGQGLERQDGLHLQDDNGTANSTVARDVLFEEWERQLVRAWEYLESPGRGALV